MEIFKPEAVKIDMGASHLNFASKVSSIALTKSFTFSDIFNGLAIATAAYLVDYASKEDGKLDEEVLQGSCNLFLQVLEAATVFAVNQKLEAERQLDEQQEAEEKSQD